MNVVSGISSCIADISRALRSNFLLQFPYKQPETRQKFQTLESGKLARTLTIYFNDARAASLKILAGQIPMLSNGQHAANR